MIEQNLNTPDDSQSAPSPLAESQSAQPPVSSQLPMARKKSSAIYIVGFLLAVLIILLSSSAALAYAITYQKYSIGQPSLEAAIAQQVQALPFTPKTPEFLLESMAKAQQKVSKHSFDVSLASESNTIATSLGLTSLDVQVKGDVDYSDLKNVKTNVDASISNQYHFQLRKKDPIIYFKADKIPQLIFLILDITPEQAEAFMTQWISVDTTPLNTDARKYLDENSTKTPESEKTVQKVKDVLMNPAILAKITQTQEDLNGHPTFKLHSKADPATIDYLGKELRKAAQDSTPQSLLYTQQKEEKLSDTVKEFSIDIWIDRQSYYMRKIVSATSILPPSSYSSSYLPTPELGSTKKVDAMSFALALTLDKFGEEIKVETPDTSVTFDDLMKQLNTLKGQSSAGGASGSFSNQFSQANNTKRQADINAILNAVHQYAADHQSNLPPDITNTSQELSKSGTDICNALVSDYLAALPSDPKLNSPVTKDKCTSEYRTGYFIKVSETNNRVTVSAPDAEIGEIISITR